MVYAVLTGDVVESSQLDAADKGMVIDALKETFQHIQEWGRAAGSDKTEPDFDIFRGDSFQGLLADPKNALKAALYIRAVMRKSQPADKEINWDARMALGIGTVDLLPENVSEGDGPAYRKSGPVLDGLKGDHRLAVTTPWDEVNNEFKATCALLDAVITKWTAPQAEITWLLLEGQKAKDIAEELGISQAAVHYRVKGAGWFAIEAALQRYREVIDSKLD
jgi:hypothetical protein